MQVGQLLQNKAKYVLVYHTPFCDHRTQRHRKTIEGSMGGLRFPRAPLQSWRTEAQSLLLVCSLILALAFRINHHLQQDQMINALRHTIGIEKLILNQYILHKIQ